MNLNERFELIKRNTQEIITEEELKKLLEEKKHPSAYVGYAPTSTLHIGHLIPILKVGDFLKAGFNFKFLIANLHAHLDDQKTPWSLLDARSIYYQEMVQAILDTLKIDTTKLMFVRGSDFQTKTDYVIDMLRMSALATATRATRAASEVCRMKDPKVSTLIYPIMQALDEQYLEADVQYGGVDQRHVLAFAREYLPKLGYKPRVEIMSPLLPGLTGAKMSASDIKSKIDLLDDKKDVEKKINSAYCVAGSLENNGVMAFVEYFLFPFKNELKIERPKKFGGNKLYKDFNELKKDFVDKKLHPADLKLTVTRELNNLLNPIRKRFEKRKDLLKEAYPK